MWKGQAPEAVSILAVMAREANESSSEEVDSEPVHFLKDHLKARGWNQAKLARAIGKSEPEVSRWIRNERDLPLQVARSIEMSMGLLRGSLIHPPSAEHMTEKGFLEGVPKESHRLIIEMRDQLRKKSRERGRQR